MNKVLRCFIALILILTFPVIGSCASKALSRPQAAALIKKYETFSNAMTIKVPVGNIWWNNLNLNINPDYPLKALQDHGILTLRESGQGDSVGYRKEYITELTPQGKDLSKSWILTKEKMPNGNQYMMTSCHKAGSRETEPCHESKGDVYSVVLARRKINGVTGITKDSIGTEVTAEFKWEWIPTADGKILAADKILINMFMSDDRIPTGSRTGRASFKLYDDGWRITGIKLQ